jgi:HSP20 family molecular chaperone IbpA
MAAENKCDNCKCHVPITLRDFFWQDPFFSTNWDDFNSLHDQMLQETKNFWGKFDRQLKRLESTEETSTAAKTKREESSSASKEVEESGSWLFPRRLMRLPSLFSEEETKDLMMKDDQTIKVRDDEKAFEVSLDTHNYRPDEIKVNVVDKVLSVEGKHEEKSEDGCKFVSRQFIRKYTLPKECRPEQVASNLSADGVLLVTAPKLALQDADRKVPIQMEKK